MGSWENRTSSNVNRGLSLQRGLLWECQGLVRFSSAGITQKTLSIKVV